jgi:23S rRNA-/tRNA-specific pseudouridylate synthase
MEIELFSPGTEGFWEIPTLYEDEYLLALNKPAGLPIAPDQANPNRANLIGLLHQGIADAKSWTTTRSLSFLMFAHRLDLEASWVLLLAKSKPVLVKLLDFFGSEQPSLSFVSLVRGAPSQDHFSVDAKLAPHPAKRGLVRVEAKFGKRSRTAFEVVERFADWTLLKCLPLTHRLHQVRVHLVRAGLRVAGDEAYGGQPLWLSSLKPNYHLKSGRSEGLSSAAPACMPSNWPWFIL